MRTTRLDFVVQHHGSAQKDIPKAVTPYSMGGALAAKASELELTTLNIVGGAGSDEPRRLPLLVHIYRHGIIA